MTLKIIGLGIVSWLLYILTFQIIFDHYQPRCLTTPCPNFVPMYVYILGFILAEVVIVWLLFRKWNK